MTVRLGGAAPWAGPSLCQGVYRALFFDPGGRQLQRGPPAAPCHGSPSTSSSVVGEGWRAGRRAGQTVVACVRLTTAGRAHHAARAFAATAARLRALHEWL